MLWKTAAELMKTDPVTVGPETQLGPLLGLLKEKKIHGVPVVDKAGVPLGVVSMTDVTRALSDAEVDNDFRNSFYQWAHEPGVGEFSIESKMDLNRRVKDVMSKRVVSAPEATSVGAMAAILIKEHVHRILITRDRKLVGVISVTDLLKCVVEAEKKELLAKSGKPIQGA